MPNIENLKPRITKENAQAMQKLSVKKRLENIQKRHLLIDAGREIFNSKMDVSEKVRQNAAQLGYKLGKKGTFGEIAMLTMIQKAIKDGNSKAFIQLAQLSGMHFDQSPEALGGKDNPIHVEAIAVAPEQVKEISEALEGDC